MANHQRFTMASDIPKCRSSASIRRSRAASSSVPLSKYSMSCKENQSEPAVRATSRDTKNDAESRAIPEISAAAASDNME